MSKIPGWSFESVAYHVGEGALYKGRPRGQPFGPLCDVGDKIGCGIRVAPSQDEKFVGNFLPELAVSKIIVFFTKNGKEIGSQIVPLPPGGFFPAVSLQVSTLSLTAGSIIVRPTSCFACLDSAVLLLLK